MNGSRDLSHLHRPVLVAQVLEHLRLEGHPAPLVVDGTVGYGGHAEAMLAAWPTTRLIGLDRDRTALLSSKERLAPFGSRVRLFHASYADLPEVLSEAGEGRPAAILLDLGVSSPQLDVAERGFSFRERAAQADMRFDVESGEPTAADLVNRLSERELADVLFHEGGERRSRAIARALVERRPVRTIGDLLDVIARWVPRDASGVHPATRTFQALRRRTNDEAGHLARGLCAAIDALETGGRLGVISFHSGEERAVKEAFAAGKRAGRLRIVTAKGIRPTEGETAENARASSARLRVAEATAEGMTR